MKKRISEIDAAVQLKKEIAEWKKNKVTGKMPEDLWRRAAALAEGFAPSSVALFFNIAYRGLCNRIASQNRPRRRKKIDSGFVELSHFIHPQESLGLDSSLEVRLSNSSGQTATIRGKSTSADWAAVFSGWLQASRPVQQERRA